MEIHVEFIGDIAVVEIPSLRIEYSNVNSFQSKVLNLVEQGHNKIAINLEHVIFMDSRGLSAFLSIIKALDKEGRMVAFNVQEPLVKIFKLTRTDQLLRQYKDREEALKAFT